MTNFTARVAGVATLALAVLPAVALTTAAHAQPAPTHVRIADIDLSTSAGQSVFSHRAQVAAHQYCEGEHALDLKAGCEAAVRAELAEAAAAQAKVRLAHS